MAINKRIIKSNDEAAGGASFNTITYSGDGQARSFTGVGFQPDLVWFKNRNDSFFWHTLWDSVRGPAKDISSNVTNAENTNSSRGYLTSFDPDGMSVVPGSVDISNMNAIGNDVVAWCWKAGGAAVSNTDGSITSQISANPAAGFSIVSYTGTGSSNTIVGTGLNTECDFVIIKNRNNTEGSSWVVQRNKTDKTKYLYLNDTRAESTSTAFQVDINTNNGTFKIDGTSRGVNTLNDDFIAYCFAEVAGFSKFGSFTGTGTTTGEVVTTDFEPAFVMWKKTSNATSAHWNMVDNKRSPSNGRRNSLYANLSSAEDVTAYDIIDFNANGFQVKAPYSQFNESGATFIYMAFANQF